MNNAIRIHLPASVDNLIPVTVEPRPPSPGEVLVRVRATSLNYHDYTVVSGAVRTGEGRIPMSDGAGEVLAVGDGVTAYKEGDHVLGTFFRDWPDGECAVKGLTTVPGDGVDGYACEYATVVQCGLTPMPKGYSFAEAATLPCAGVTAWRALVVNGQIKCGDTVLVQGTGGVSIFALQLAKYAGATVIATSSSDEKLERLRNLGADHFINYKAEPNWGTAAAKLCPRGGVDHVVEIGGAGTLPQSIRAIRNGGHIALIGILAGREGQIPTRELMLKQGRLLGLTVGSRRHQLDLIRACESTGLKPVIDTRRFPLAGLADAFRLQISGGHFGKICVDI